MITLGLGGLDRLVELADALADTWAVRASRSTTPARERAVLRLFGVHGLDQSGRPLAGEAVERYLAGHPDRLAAGLALPFAMALLEYDLGAQQLALEVASGRVDLALESELLRHPDRRAMAEQETRRLAVAALDRIDANRTARRELIDLLGDAHWPWLGASLAEPNVDEARPEAGRLAAGGADAIRVRVPAGRELADRLHDAGVDLPEWRARDVPHQDSIDELAPAGSQRGLAALRQVLDEAAAERRRYVRLATVAPALAAPEQAVVAAFERVDIVEADLAAEIVESNVDPERALADHVFAHRLQRRAGSMVLLGAGPLVVAPDLARGVPSDPATRAGRALALQLLGVALARRDGVGPGQLVLGAVPAWLADERNPAAQAIAEVALRSALYPGHPLAFEEPVGSARAMTTWPYVLAASLPAAGDAALIIRHARPDSIGSVSLSTRAATQVAAEVRRSLRPTPLDGAALDHARAALEAATLVLEGIAEHGWSAVLGVPVKGRDRAFLGADAVAERSEPFDPFEPLD